MVPAPQAWKTWANSGHASRSANYVTLVNIYAYSHVNCRDEILVGETIDYGTTPITVCTAKDEIASYHSCEDLLAHNRIFDFSYLQVRVNPFQVGTSYTRLRFSLRGPSEGAKGSRYVARFESIRVHKYEVIDAQPDKLLSHSATGST